jgi:putative DNA primase/helicase
MPSRLANGVEPGTSPYTDDAEELRKVLFSALLAGDTALLLDNVPSGVKVRSPVLCGFVTAPVYTDRRLGASERPTLPNRCTVVMSGNNITPASDMARRSIVTRLVVDAETARGREFEIPDIKAYVSANRSRLLVDALTVMVAYAQAAPAGMLKPLESFEQYSRIARDPLVWLGVGDAVETQHTEAEDDIAPLREAFDLLARYPKFGGKEPFAARDLAAECDQMVAGAELKAAIEGAGCSDASSPVKVGYWLRAHRDRVAAGRKLVQCGTPHGLAQWLLRELNR